MYILSKFKAGIRDVASSNMPAKCARCQTDIKSEDFVICNECQGKFHFDCSISEQNYKKLSTAKKKLWKCSSCTQLLLPNAKTATRANSNSAVDEEETEDKSLKSEVRDIKIILGTIMNKLDNIDQIKSDIIELKKNTKFIGEQYDSIKIQLTENNNIINDMGKTIKVLEKCNEEKDEKIKDLNYKIVKMEQYSRNKNIEVCEFPQTPNENCIDIILNIAKELKINLQRENVEDAHRVPSNKKNKPPPIIIHFQSKKFQEQFVAMKNVIMFKGTPNEKKIYINEHISPYYKQLLMMVKHAARDKNYKFVWFRKDKIYARKIENSKPVIIESERDLQKLK